MTEAELKAEIDRLERIVLDFADGTDLIYAKGIQYATGLPIDRCRQLESDIYNIMKKRANGR